MSDDAIRPYSKSKLKLNSNKVEIERCKKVLSVFIYIVLFCSQTSGTQFEFC